MARVARPASIPSSCALRLLLPTANCLRASRPESNGIVEWNVRYVKQNAVAGRGDELTRFEGYQALAPVWRDQVLSAPAMPEQKRVAVLGEELCVRALEFTGRSLGALGRPPARRCRLAAVAGPISVGEAADSP